MSPLRLQFPDSRAKSSMLAKDGVAITELDMNPVQSVHLDKSCDEASGNSGLEVRYPSRQPASVLAFARNNVTQMQKSASSQQLGVRSEQHKEYYDSSPSQKGQPNDANDGQQEPDSFVVSLLSPPSKTLSHSKSEHSHGSRSNKGSVHSKNHKRTSTGGSNNPYLQLGKNNIATLAIPVQNRNNNVGLAATLPGKSKDRGLTSNFSGSQLESIDMHLSND